MHFNEKIIHAVRSSIPQAVNPTTFLIAAPQERTMAKARLFLALLILHEFTVTFYLNLWASLARKMMRKFFVVLFRTAVPPCKLALTGRMGRQMLMSYEQSLIITKSATLTF